MSFSATDAAFEGFRLVRRNPMALVAWTFVYLLFTLANVAAMSQMGPALADLTALMEGMEGTSPTSMADLAPVMEAYGQLLSSMSWLFPLSMIVTAVLTAAVARGVLEPKARATFGYLKLGMDELRVLIVTLVLTILLGLIAFFAFFVAVFIGVAATTLIEDWGWLVGFASTFAAIVLIVWLAVRWSLAVPITLAEKKFAVFDSFRVTRGKFWPLLGMAIIAGVMTLLVMLLSMIVSAPLGIMSGMSMAGAMSGGDSAAMFEAYTLTNPWVIASSVVNAFIYALVLAVIYAPFSRAYVALSGKGGEAA